MAYPLAGQGFAALTALVTRKRACAGSGHNPGGPRARLGPVCRWPCPGSNPYPCPIPASGAGWPPCWPCGTGAASSKPGDNGFVDPGRRVDYNSSTYAAGWWWACDPDRSADAHAAAPRPPPNEENQENKTEEDWKKTLEWNGGKKTQAKKTLFKPADSAHFQNDGGSVKGSFGLACGRR
jgi:hypothetical protein